MSEDLNKINEPSNEPSDDPSEEDMKVDRKEEEGKSKKMVKWSDIVKGSNEKMSGREMRLKGLIKLK